MMAMKTKRKKSNAEAMKQSRAKCKTDPQKYQAYLLKEHERYRKRRAAGKLKSINELSEAEKRRQRRKWKIEKRKQRQKQSEAAELAPNTPPASPVSQPEETSQKRVGRKRVKREDRKAYRTIASQNIKIRKLESQVKQLKRRMQRMKTIKNSPTKETLSPASKATSLINTGNMDTIRRELTFAYALNSDVENKVKNSLAKRKQKNDAHKMIIGPIMKKYRLLSQAKSKLALSHKCIKKIAKRGQTNDQKERTKQYDVQKVEEYFLRDDVSVPTAGKKDTITRSKDKRQKRYLADTMAILFKKFRSEQPHMKISYPTFTRLRPFHVLPAPPVDRRDTVKCKLHHNAELKALKLHTHGVTKSANLTNLISSVVCSPRQKHCMYQECENCQGKIKEIYREPNSRNLDKEISYSEWNTVTEKKQTSKGEIDVKVTKKVEKTDKICNVCEMFERELTSVMQHEYRIFNQYSQLRSLKQTIQDDEAIIQVDFSENYLCKGAIEVQSMHFGASRSQVSLHTSHATVLVDNKMQTKCYCTLSSDTRHSPAAIWAHLVPVLDDVRKMGKRKLHFISDGPTSQYRNITNFQFLASYPFELGFENVTWNFLESAHGKGPADGIGATVKNAADREVSHGKDMLDCETMFSVLKGKINIELHQITAQDIDEFVNCAENFKAPAIKGTMRMHQLLCPQKNVVRYRPLSCYCNKSTRSCDCGNPSEVTFANTTKQHTQKRPRASTSNTAVSKIEAQLNEEQIKLFKHRFAEGYNVTVLNMSELDAQKSKEYLMWKAWRAAMLQETSSAAKENEEKETDNDESENEENTESSSEEEWLPEKQLLMKQNSFYAVCFLTKKRKTFYIGHTLEKDDQSRDEIEMKFLERRMVNGKNEYQWPRRDDVCTVCKNAVIMKIDFHGPPPYTTSKEIEKRITSQMKNIKL